MSEPTKIEPYYQTQGKQLVDCLFDKGFLSESLSRDGMDAIEELLAFYLQVGANSAARCAEVSKKYKATAQRKGEDPARSEEEMRWIARAKEAEALIAPLSIAKGELWARVEKAEARVEELEKLLVREEKANAAWAWSREVCVFLKDVLTTYEGKASKLLTEAVELGIIPEPLGFAAARYAEKSTGGEGCLPPCGYESGGPACGNIHNSGTGIGTKCALPFGHPGPHESADKREGWV